MRIKYKSALSLILLAASCFTLCAQDSVEQEEWEQNSNITGLKKIDLGQWEVPDTVNPQWTDKYGHTEYHNYPSCYLLDLKEDKGEVIPGKAYVLKDMADMFGPEGLLKDAHDNLDRLMQSPLMTGTKLVYTAKGGPVEVDLCSGRAASAIDCVTFTFRPTPKQTQRLCRSLRRSPTIRYRHSV